MLVLMRKEGEELVLTLEDQRRISIVLLTAERGRARIGVEAPRSIIIDRAEIDADKHPELVNGNV